MRAARDIVQERAPCGRSSHRHMRFDTCPIRVKPELIVVTQSSSSKGTPQPDNTASATKPKYPIL